MHVLVKRKEKKEKKRKKGNSVTANIHQGLEDHYLLFPETSDFLPNVMF